MGRICLPERIDSGNGASFGEAAIVIETEPGLRLRAKIVYGDPILAELTTHWTMSSPVRRLNGYGDTAAAQFEDTFGLRLGEWHLLEGESAVRIIEKIERGSPAWLSALHGEAWRAYRLRGELKFEPDRIPM